MKVVNLTPHTVVLHPLSYSRVLYPERKFRPSGQIARVIMKGAKSQTIGFGIFVIDENPGDVVDLPKEKRNTYLIVSYRVQEAATKRTDLITPSGLLRDRNGRIVGCEHFMRRKEEEKP